MSEGIKVNRLNSVPNRTLAAAFRRSVSIASAVLIVGMLWSLTSIATAQEQTTETDVLDQISRGRYRFEPTGEELEYAMFVPTSYDESGTDSFPLIVSLHGLYSNPQQILRYPKFAEHAEEFGYILVAPMGYNDRGWYGSRGTRGADSLGAKSEQDVMNVLQIIQDNYRIDQRRIYLLGHSMGGGGTLHLAIKYPQIWAAIAPIAPAVPRDARRLESAQQIPAIVIQGDRDRLVIGTRRWVAQMEELGMEHVYIEVEGGGHVDVAFQHFPQIFEFFNSHTKPDQSD